MIDVFYTITGGFFLIIPRVFLNFIPPYMENSHLDILPSPPPLPCNPFHPPFPSNRTAPPLLRENFKTRSQPDAICPSKTEPPQKSAIGGYKPRKKNSIWAGLRKNNDKESICKTDFSKDENDKFKNPPGSSSLARLLPKCLHPPLHSLPTTP